MIQPTQPPRPAGGLGGLLHNRTALIAGAGGVAIVALVLWMRSRGAGGGAGSDGATPGNPAAINTSGSDVASALGSYQSQEQQMLNEFGRSLQETLAGFQPPATAPGSTVPPPPTGPRVPRSAPRLPAPPTGPTRRY